MITIYKDVTAKKKSPSEYRGKVRGNHTDTRHIGLDEPLLLELEKTRAEP